MFVEAPGRAGEGMGTALQAAVSSPCQVPLHTHPHGHHVCQAPSPPRLVFLGKLSQQTGTSLLRSLWPILGIMKQYKGGYDVTQTEPSLFYASYKTGFSKINKNPTKVTLNSSYC